MDSVWEEEEEWRGREQSVLDISIHTDVYRYPFLCLRSRRLARFVLTLAPGLLAPSAGSPEGGGVVGESLKQREEKEEDFCII